MLMLYHHIQFSHRTLHFRVSEFIYLFIWLHLVLVAMSRISAVACGLLIVACEL